MLNTIEFFLDDWEKRLDEPLDVLLGDLPFNVLLALEGTLTAWLSKRSANKPTTFDPSNPTAGFKEELVNRTRQLISSSDPTFDLLKSVHAIEASTFIQEIQKTPVDARLVLAPLQSLLSRVRGDLAMISKLISAELRDSGRRRQNYLQAYSHALARHLILNDDTRDLKKLPKEVLSRFGLSAALQAHLPMLTSDQALMVDAWKCVRSAAQAIASKDLTQKISSELTRTGLSSPYGKVYAFTQAVSRILIPNPSGSKVSDLLPLTRNSIVKLGRQALVSRGEFALRYALTLAGLGPRTGIPQPAPEYKKAQESLAALLLNWVAQLPTVAPSKDLNDGPDIRFAIEEGTERHIRTLLVTRASQKYGTLIEEIDAYSLGYKLVTILADEIAGPGSDFDTPDGASQLLTSWGARRDVQLVLAASTEKQAALISKALSEAASEVSASDSVPLWGGDELSVWQQWVETVAKATQRWNDAWRDVDWTVLQSAELERALGEIPATYAVEEEYDIVFSVRGIDAQGERWTAGPIHWFAKSALALSDANARSAEETSPTKLQAWLRVLAPSKSAALQRASEILELALSAATYALSVSQQHSGLRPVIDSFLFAGEVNQGSWRVTAASQREELFREQTAREGEFIKFTQTYAPIIQRFSKTGAQSEIDMRLLRAFAWYREGRWEINHTSRFLAYFVAFEHILVGGNLGNKFLLPIYAQGLLQPWITANSQEIVLLESIGDHAVRIRQRALASAWLGQELDNSPKLLHWRTDVRSLLITSAMSELLMRATTMVVASDADLQALKAYATDLLTFTANRAPIEAKRDLVRQRWRFSLELLQLRRHEVAHEALASGPDMKLYALGIENVLEQVLNTLTHSALNEAAQVHTVEDVIAWNRPPWLE